MKIVVYTLAGLAILAGIVFFSALFTIPVYYLWNWLVPSIFGLREVTFIESWGLLALSSFLFKSTSSVSKSNSR